MEKYSFHQLRKLFKDEPLANIQKVSEEIGPNAAVKKDTGRWSLLHIASTTDRSDVTQHLITKGSDVNVLDKDGKSPLYYCQSQEVAKLLIDAGAEVNHPSILGKTPVHYACISNASPEVLKLLLKSGALVNAQDRFGDTPFLNACGMAYGCIDEEEFAENLPKINILIDHGVDVNHTNAKGENGLHICCQYRSQEIVEILLKCGVAVNAVNKKHQTPLFMACCGAVSAREGKEGILTTLTVLLEHGADPMIPDEQGLTPLHVLMLRQDNYASESDIASFADVLVKHGASLNVRDNMLRSPVHYASYAAAHQEWPRVLQELMPLGADINLQDAEGFTPVHVTATRDRNRLTTFQWPWDCIEGNDTVKQAINWNCARKNGVTLAHIVLAHKGLKLGGCEVPWDINAQDEFMSTPMHYAEFTNNTSAPSYVWVSGTVADVTLANCLGESVIDCAVTTLNQEMVDQLKKYGGSHPTLKNERRVPSSSCELCAQFSRQGEGPFYKPFEKKEEPVSVDVKEVQINPPINVEEYVEHVLHTPMRGKVSLQSDEVAQICQETENLIGKILDKVAHYDPRFRSIMIVSGSVRERTKAGLPDEFDFMCKLEKFGSCCRVIEDDTCSPGFIRLAKSSDACESVNEFFDNDGYLVPYLVRSKFQQIVRQVMFDSKLWQNCRICSNFVLPSSDTRIATPKPSIIIELCWNGPVYKNMIYSVDVVPVIDIGAAFWPKDAISYSPLLENVEKQCLFTMAIPRFERGIFGNEVRISYSLVESQIFDNIPENLKDAYIVAKAIREVCPALVDEEQIFHDEKYHYASSLFPSYWLKTALFHELDKHGLDERHNLKVWVQRIYERIRQYVCQDEEFPSFFMPRQDFVASRLKGRDQSRTDAAKLERELTACKKICEIIHRLLSSGDRATVGVS